MNAIGLSGIGCSRGVLRYSPWDALLIALALAYGLVLTAAPAAPIIALGVWWGSNTIAHYFIHTPFFCGRFLNSLFGVYLSGVLGVPQTLWRERHLAHHAGRPWSPHFSPRLMVEVLVVALVWACLATTNLRWFCTAYLPGYLAGLLLCSLHGYYEHARGGATSHHGRLYNFLFFNDGYHVEHHAHPGKHWTRLPGGDDKKCATSRWPAVLRWLDLFSLESLERLVLRSPLLQRLVLHAHAQAFRRLLPALSAARYVGIVGGGLFPRTWLILRELLPSAQLVVIDCDLNNLSIARTFIKQEVEFLHDFFDPSRPNRFDLLIVPLAFVGERETFYRSPPARSVIVHDWIWRRRGQGVVVSWLLLKRLNLVQA